jgi:hypothetical protein
MRKQPRINQNVLDPVAYNRQASALLSQGCYVECYHHAQFIYDHEGNIRGGMVMQRTQVNNRVVQETPCGYIHS